MAAKRQKTASGMGEQQQLFRCQHVKLATAVEGF
jgi:hypothetical protein